MSETNQTRQRRFGGIMLFHFCALSAVGTFAMAYALSLGATATLVGTMLACYRVSAVAGQFFWGGVSDRLQRSRMLFRMCIVLSLAVCAGYCLVPGSGALVGFYALMGFVQTPLNSNLDTWVLKSFEGSGRAYSAIRSIASFGNALFLLGYGMLLEKLGYGIMLGCMAALVALALLLTCGVPETPHGEGTPRMNGRDMLALFRNGPYLSILAVLLVAGLASVTLWQIKIMIYQSVGGSVAYQGYDGFISCMAQVLAMRVVMALSGRVRAGIRAVVAVAAMLGEILVYILAWHPAQVLLGGALGGIGYALLLTAVRPLIQRTVSPGVAATAQGLSDAVFMSIPGFVGGICGGLLIDGLGLKSLIFICAAVECVAVALAALLLFRRDERKEVAHG